MIVCPVCGFRNLDSNDRCFKCSALLKRDDALYKEAASTAARRNRGERYLRQLLSPLDWLKHRPWFSAIFEVPDDGVFRYPFTAGLLSVVPGMGHVYAGQMVKGILVFAIWIILLAIAAFTIYEDWSNWYLFALLLVWFFTWADAVGVAARRNGDTWRLRKTLALACGAMMIIGVTLTVTQYLGIGFLSLEKVGTDVLAPEVRKGERIAFSAVPLWFRSPRVGEIVMFDPPRFEAHRKNDIYSVNIKKYYQRVLGGPGDRLSKKGTAFYRNGQLMASDEIPFLGEKLPDFEVVVPEKSYFVPVTGIPSDILATFAGAGKISYVGDPGFVFKDWPGFGIIPEDQIWSKGIGVISPPARRRWLR